MSETPHLSIEQKDGVLIATINRPARRNALAAQTLAEFAALEPRVKADPSVRALIITGSGYRAFCAGADLKERQGMSEQQVREQLQNYRRQLGWLDTSPIPVIAAINGVALGGGLELALLCDLRVAAPTAEFAAPETSLGIIPGAGGTQRLPRLIGEAGAKEMILLGRRIDAASALRIGLVHRVCGSETPVLEDALEWILPIRNGAPIAQAAALEAIDAARDLPLVGGLERELQAYERCLVSEDRVEALNAFAQKRRPVFKGK